MLTANPPYSDHEVASTYVNLMIAAGEAPASTLAQLLEELAQNDQVTNKLLEEIAYESGKKAEQNNCQPKTGCPVHSRKTHVYAENCCKEALRLFAPATLVQRRATCNTIVDGATVQAGQIVCICAHAVHMDTKQWVNPRHFDPNRDHLDITMLGSQASFMSFSGGMRGCPGRHLALTLLKVALTQTIERFQILPVPSTVSKTEGRLPKFVEWQMDGISVALKRR